MDNVINVNRQSVCMGDDCISHEIAIEIRNNVRLSELVSKLFGMRYLPSISGGKATWVLMYKKHPLTVIAEEWNEPKYLINKDIRLCDLVEEESPSFFLSYLAQLNPSEVYDKLRQEVDGNLRFLIDK